MSAAPICVVTPSFHQGRFLERTVCSVLDQGVEGLDFWVIDGGSQDGSLEVLERYRQRLRFVSEPDRGQAHAVNKGLRRTSAPIVGWLNSDDVYLPGALNAVCRFFDRHPRVDVVYGDAFHIDEDDRFLEAYPTEPWQQDRLLETCFLCQPAVFFRRQVIEDHGPLDERLQFCMDYEFWLRLARGGVRFRHLPRPLAGSRLHAETKTLGQRVAVHAETNTMLRRHLGSTPSRWLANWATEMLRQWQVSPRDRRRYVRTLILVTVAGALRWNRWVSAPLRQLFGEWWRHALDSGAAKPEPPPAPTSISESTSTSRADLDSRASLTIGFDVSQTGPRREGCGMMAASTIQAIADLEEVDLEDAHRYLLYATFGDHYWEPLGPQSTLEIKDPRFERTLALESPAAAKELWRLSDKELEPELGHPNIVHANNFYCPTELRRARLVYTLHDLGFLVDPSWTGEANRQACYEGVWKASLFADAIVAVSQASRDHFLSLFPHYPADRVAVTRLGCRFEAPVEDEALTLPSPLVAGGFFLMVGSPEPRKNQKRVVRAYRQYAGGVADPLPLVWAGGGDAAAFQAPDSEGPGQVHSLGYVDDDTLLALYRGCRSVLFLSLWEGFGLPVLEALSQGAVVVASDLAVLREVAGDAACFVDPIDSVAMARALERVGGDGELCARLSREGQERAQRFTWRRTAKSMLEVYRQVVERPKLTLPG